jgi:hypothetical protein
MIGFNVEANSEIFNALAGHMQSQRIYCGFSMKCITPAVYDRSKERMRHNEMQARVAVT